jgi:hypothetical protein
MHDLPPAGSLQRDSVILCAVLVASMALEIRRAFSKNALITVNIVGAYRNIDSGVGINFALAEIRR